MFVIMVVGIFIMKSNPGKNQRQKYSVKKEMHCRKLSSTIACQILILSLLGPSMENISVETPILYMIYDFFGTVMIMQLIPNLSARSSWRFVIDVQLFTLISVKKLLIMKDLLCTTLSFFKQIDEICIGREAGLL